MAITKLLHIKETPGTRPNSEGLKNAINYVLNPEKTQNGYLTGSNCGMNAEEAYAAFMDTKDCYGKYEGRQGYHFIISFDEKDNVSHGVMLNVMSEFAECYLGEDFDYVYSVHDDKGHTHGHLVFNSVNRNTGYKYRYEKGDWAKYIQPITDKICEEYGLRQLDVLQHGKDKEQGNTNWELKIKYDVDDCINSCVSYEDFITQMEEIYGYDLREGVLKKYGHYIAYKPFGESRAVRSYRLGKGYSPTDIKRRINNNNRRNRGEIFVPPYIEKASFGSNKIRYLKSSYLRWDNMSTYQKNICIKMLEAKRMYGSMYSTRWENERNVAAINSIMKELSFVRKYGISDAHDLEKVVDTLKNSQSDIYERMDSIKTRNVKYMKGRRGQRSDFNLYKEYVGMYNRLQKEEQVSPDVINKIKIEMEKIEDIIDVEEVSAAFIKYQDNINECRQEMKRNKANMKMADKVMKSMPDKKEHQKEMSTGKGRTSEKEKKHNMS